MRSRPLALGVALLAGLALAYGARGATRASTQGERLTPIAYTRPNAAGGADIWLTSPDGRRNRHVRVNLATASIPVWSRDGRLLAATGALPGEPRGQEDIFVFRPDGSRMRNVTQLLSAPRPDPGTWTPLFKSFSPNGRLLAYTIFEFSRGAVELVIGRTSGVPGTTVVAIVGGGSDEGFAGFGVDWSPAGGRLVTPAETVDPSSQLPVTAIFAVRPVADAERRGLYYQVTHPRTAYGYSVTDVLPVYSPDGGRVAFVRTVLPPGGALSSALMVVNANGTNERRVALFPNQDLFGISWSPNGRQLVFDRGQDLTHDPLGFTHSVWSIRANGTGLRLLRGAPSWSPSWRWR